MDIKKQKVNWICSASDTKSFNNSHMKTSFVLIFLYIFIYTHTLSNNFPFPHKIWLIDLLTVSRSLQSTIFK